MEVYVLSSRADLSASREQSVFCIVIRWKLNIVRALLERAATYGVVPHPWQIPVLWSAKTLGAALQNYEFFSVMLEDVEYIGHIIQI